MTAKPYVGITGFMSRGEVEAVLETWPKAASHKLMVGVLASGQTVRQPKRYPVPVERIADIFVNDSRCLNLIHYATDFQASLDIELRRLASLVGHRLDGFQLNISWPDPMFIDRVKSFYPSLKFVLQVGPEAASDYGYNAGRIADVIHRDYERCVDYVLIDLSAGRGKMLNREFAADCVQAITSRTGGSVAVVVAGGLSPENVSVVAPIARFAASGLSIDAESHLRDERDDLDVSRAIEYGHAALQAVGLKS